MDATYRPFRDTEPFRQSHSSGSHSNFYVPQSEHVFPTSGGHGAYVDTTVLPNYGFHAQPVVTNLAMQYSSAVVGQGAEVVQKNISMYLSSLRLKYYFAVNNSYVAKKLGLILFPFAHTKWSTHFDPSGPVPPGDDINAPDLYIPLMAFITYVLIAGAIMGIQGRFSPEHLGMLSSEALGWLVLEVLIMLFSIYVLNIQSNICYLDILAFSGYKYVSMIVILLVYLLLNKSGYYFSLMYVSVALAFFLIRTLKLKILPHAEAYPSEGNKRRVYLLLTVALVQPLIMWWLTRRMLIIPNAS